MKNKSFKNQESIENVNQSFRLEIEKHEIFFESINEIIQKNEAFVNVSLIILIVVQSLQKTDHFAQQQRIKLFNTQIIKRLNKVVFSNTNKNDQFSQKTKLTKILTKKITTEK